MSEDVKVKFGGDFSDVEKNAESSTKKAGVSLEKWFGDFNKSVTKSIVSSLALSAIFGKWMSAAQETLDYFKELDRTIKQLGGSSADFQRLAGAGKQFGLSMEQVGKAVQTFNKFLGAAGQGDKAKGSFLESMGFSPDDIKKGTVDATEVIMRLSDEFAESGNSAIIGEKAMKLFGEAGAALVPIIRSSREEIKAMLKDVTVYSDEAIRRLAEAAKRIDKAKEQLNKTFVQEPLSTYASYLAQREGAGLVSAVFKDRESYGATPEERARRMAADIFSRTNDKEVQREALSHARYGSQRLEGNILHRFFTGEERTTQWFALQKEMERLFNEINAPKPPKKSEEVAEVGPSGVAALAASSLQQLGGGDIASVMSGLGANEVAENTKRTADGVQKLVEKNVDQTPVSDVAK